MASSERIGLVAAVGAAAVLGLMGHRPVDAAVQFDSPTPALDRPIDAHERPPARFIFIGIVDSSDPNEPGEILFGASDGKRGELTTFRGPR